MINYILLSLFFEYAYKTILGINMFRFYISLIISKLAYMFLRVTKLSDGTAIIGLFAKKICPKFLIYANKFISGKKINITGTNGKTTTSGLIAHMLYKSGRSVINNSMGANMLNGVINALALQINPFKKSDYSVIELDEANVELVYKDFDADYLIVTNLFRDQLDRYGELETTKKFIQKGIDLKPDLTLLLNADDPLVSSIKGNNLIFYGVNSVTYADDISVKNSNVEEIFNCPCGRNLSYSKKFYAQQGHYYCECGYRRPEPKYSADIVLHKQYSALIINGTEYRVPLVGLFNAYNALAAISLALELGVKNIENSLKSFKVAFGRSELKTLYGHKTLIQLIKNPIGANEVLKTIDLNSSLMIAINDNYADGRDVSWLWDADFEVIKDIKREVVVSGIRAADMALRLKYAGIKVNYIKVIPDLKKAVDYIGKTADNDITILPTYTALLNINKMKELKNVIRG